MKQILNSYCIISIQLIEISCCELWYHPQIQIISSSLSHSFLCASVWNCIRT